MAHPMHQPSRVCETCGERFTRKPGSHEPHAKFKARRYCSRECLNERQPVALLARLLAKAQIDDAGCWVWTGAIQQGYGVLGRGSRSDGTVRAHVASYELQVGAVPDGLVLDHLCRNRACINPEHLEPVTNAENSRRGARAKITHDDVTRIRALVDQGRTQVAVAAEYDLHPAHVSRIVSRKRWGNE